VVPYAAVSEGWSSERVFQLQRLALQGDAGLRGTQLFCSTGRRRMDGQRGREMDGR
jgi:hypothetical protein